MTHAAYTIQQGEELEPFFAPAREALAASGLPIELSNPEWGFGQWEMNREPDEPLAMADGHALFKLGLKRLASSAGLAATFMARPSGESFMGSSCHIHVSLTDTEGRSIFFDRDGEHGIAPRLLHSIGGVLEREPELLLFYAPTVNSYRRGFPSYGWGFDNRVIQCRVVGEDPASMRFEYRVPGADVNPHLALSALLASIIDGLGREADPGPAYAGTGEPGPDERLPRTLEQASDRFASSEFVRRCFGSGVVDHYTSVAQHEVRMFNDAVTDWEKRRYFETV
jgi:glutamine synthetase